MSIWLGVLAGTSVCRSYVGHCLYTTKTNHTAHGGADVDPTTRRPSEMPRANIPARSNASAKKSYPRRPQTRHRSIANSGCRTDASSPAPDRPTDRASRVRFSSVSYVLANSMTTRRCRHHARAIRNRPDLHYMAESLTLVPSHAP